ncbi:hypothetical protein [uncultured Amnibacterium sp.]|uniref:hypothetical protein n=1 Tax=uncultured Amnibacterium sp. TaxID=1631851 RepID=UPI0035CA71F7
MRYLGLAAVISGALLIALAPKQNLPAVASDSDVLTYALSGQREILYVSDNASNPVIGGLARTPSVPISRAEFESGCDRWLIRFHAVVTDGDSACLRAHRDDATTYLRGGPYELSEAGFTLYVAGEEGR